jgi:hypothetical protein
MKFIPGGKRDYHRAYSHLHTVNYIRHVGKRVAVLSEYYSRLWGGGGGGGGKKKTGKKRNKIFGVF